MDPLFEVHILNEVGKANAQHIAQVFELAVTSLRDVCPLGREWAIARTKLEEACFFAKKAMANNPTNQV